MLSERKSGILMHISSLYGDYSIGSFGKNAKEFIDFIKENGFSYWQVLPFTVTDECNSPYKSVSAFGGNPYFIDLERLYEEGLLTKDELNGARQHTPYESEYERLSVERLALLDKANKRFSDREKINSFLAENSSLSEFCRFMALKKVNGDKPWQEWEIFTPSANTLSLWEFLQYQFFTQWAEIKSYANSKGVKIIGDMPFYVAQDSCDVYENREMFKLNEKGYPLSVAGVPPDYFSEDGQLWGNPLYDFDKMSEDGFSWWKKRINHALKMFDGVRIDHFRAIESYWSVDANEKTAKNGKWVKGPGMSLINALKEGNEDKLIIAEDLGDITNEVRDLVEESGFPGMRVFQFAFLSDDNSLHMPHNHIQNSVVYSGTHDNNTLFGYLWESDENTRQRTLDYVNFPGGDWGGATPLLLRSVFSSTASLAIIPVQDFLMYGSDTRINKPGIAKGNWTYRVTREQLWNADCTFFKKMNAIYKRN